MEPSYSLKPFFHAEEPTSPHRPEIVHIYLAYILKGVGEKGVMIHSS